MDSIHIFSLLLSFFSFLFFQKLACVFLLLLLLFSLRMLIESNKKKFASLLVFSKVDIF